MNKVICIVGPTASGKTSLGVKLATELNGEVISADSMQIYKELWIGTAKVTKDEMEGIKHHLIDFVDIDEEFSVAQFKSLAIEKIDDILKRGKVPIIVGGTGLYVSSILQDMDFEEESIDEEYRNSLYLLAEKFGNEYVHNMLKKVDKVSASNIHPNNLKRVIRALEMAKSNITKTERLEKQKIKNKNNKYEFYTYCLNWDKLLLNERINKRVDLMIDLGLEKEAKLVSKIQTGTLRQAIGYKEFSQYFNNEKTLEQVIEEIKLRTRQYAKRQMTWFKRINNIKFIEMKQNKEDIIKEIKRELYEEKK